MLFALFSWHSEGKLLKIHLAMSLAVYFCSGWPAKKSRTVFERFRLIVLLGSMNSSVPHPRLELAALHFFKAGAAIDHYGRAGARCLKLDALRGRRRFVDHEGIFAVSGKQHHAVVVARGRKRDLALDHVALHEVRLALERLPPAPAAGRYHPHDLTVEYRLAVDEATQVVRHARGVDGDAERRAGLPAIEAIAAEPNAVGGDDGAAIDQRAIMLVVAEPAAALAGAAGIGAQRELLDQERKARLGEFGRLIARVGHDVNGIVAVGVIATAGAAAQDLARQEWFAVAAGAVKAGVADGLLVRRHLPLGGLRHHAGQKPDTAQQHERARIGGRRPLRRDQRALGRKDNVENLAHAFVDVDFGGALRRIGEIAQDRCDPFDQKSAARVIGRPVDRPRGLRIGAGEIERYAVALFDQLECELVQLRIGDAVMLDIILPAVFAVGDLRQQLAPEGVAAGVEDRLKTSLHGFAAEPVEQFPHAPRAHQTSLHLAVEVGGERFGHARVALDDGEDGVVADASAVELDGRYGEA